MARKKSKNNYFTSETEEYIVKFNNSDDPEYRNEIFRDHIYLPFYKLAENIIHTFKFYYTEVDDLEDLKHEVICFLLEKLHYFKVGKGKAFSYFSIVGKNYLILYNNKNYAKKKGKADLIEVDTDNGILNTFEHNEALSEKIEFLDIFIEKMDHKILKIFNKESDILVADAVLTLFKKRSSLEIFNKKALYIYIREITGCDTPAITKVTKVLQKYYIRAFNQWETGQPIVL